MSTESRDDGSNTNQSTTSLLFKGLGIPIVLDDPENFLKVRETLSRIGIASKADRKLFQSCHIFHKRGSYAIMHFKEMFAMDGKPNTMTRDDLKRRNAIVKLLEEWNLVKPLVKISDEDVGTLSTVKVLSFAEKGEWELIPKYSIGKKRITT